MSQAELNKLMEHLATDKQGVAKFQEALAKGVEETIAFAKELGFEITESDITELHESAKEMILEKARGFLSDDKDLSEGMKNLKAFMKHSDENPEVESKLSELGSAEDVVDYAKELGFEFTEEDFAEFAKLIMAKEEELSDEDLEKVAGGFFTASLAVIAITAASVSIAVGAAATAVAGVTVGSMAVGAGMAILAAEYGDKPRKFTDG